MKYLLILFWVLWTVFVFAEIDTDGDGYEDDIDVCPYVRGISLRDGCPNIDVFQWVRPEIQVLQKHACYKQVALSTGYIYGTPICTGENCVTIQRNDSFRICDIIFPVILSSENRSPVKRGAVYFLRDL